MLDIWDSLTILWTPKGLGSKHLFSGSTVHSTHACLTGSGQRHSLSVAVFGSHTTVLTMPKCWGLLLQLGYPFASSFSWALFRNSDHAILHQALTSVPGLFSPGVFTETEAAPSPVVLLHVKTQLLPTSLWCQHHPENLHTFPSPDASLRHSLSPSWPQVLCADPE